MITAPMRLEAALAGASFVCVDCESFVFNVPATMPAPASQRCAVCQWIAELPDEADRQAVRALLDVEPDEGRP